jgi:hypothetical protein
MRLRQVERARERENKGAERRVRVTALGFSLGAHVIVTLISLTH